MGSPATNNKKRQLLRQKLRAAGKTEAEIEIAVAEFTAKSGRSYTPPPPGTVHQTPKPAWQRRLDKVGKQHAIADAEFEARAEAERQQILAIRRAEQDRALTNVDLDDTRHRPAYVDPLLTGAARATGVAASAVKRGRTFTKYEYDTIKSDPNDRCYPRPIAEGDCTASPDLVDSTATDESAAPT